MGRDIGQACPCHKSLHAPCNGAWVTRLKGCAFFAEEKSRCHEAVRILLLALAIKGFQKVCRAFHKGNGANAGGGFRRRYHNAAFRRVSHSPLHSDDTAIKIDVLPLKADALATPQACCDKQLQNTAKVKIQCVQLFKEPPCIFFG